MLNKIILSAILSTLVIYSSTSSAREYEYNQSNSGYSSHYSKLMGDFESKRYELNQLYDQGAKESDAKAKALITELNSLSAKLDDERVLMHSSYRNDRHRYHNNDRDGFTHRSGGHYHGCRGMSDW